MSEDKSMQAALDRLDKMAAAEQKGLVLSLVIYGILVLLVGFYAIAVPSMLKERLTPDATADLIVGEIEEALPTDQELLTEAENYVLAQVTRGLNMSEEKLPTLRTYLFERLDEGMSDSSKVVFDELKVTVRDAVKANKEEYRKALLDLKDEAKIDKLADELAAALKSELDDSIDEKLKLEQLTARLDELDKDSLTAKQKAQRDLIICANKLARSEGFADRLAQRLLDPLTEIAEAGQEED